jgi:hypothetical protein
VQTVAEPGSVETMGRWNRDLQSAEAEISATEQTGSGNGLLTITPSRRFGFGVGLADKFPAARVGVRPCQAGEGPGCIVV